MDRRQFLKIAAASAATGGLSGPIEGGRAMTEPKGGPGEKPNFVFIMADDLSRDWLGCYGSEENVTPALDNLAMEGTRYLTCYSAAICTPTRVMLLTGRYPFRTGWTRHHDAPRWGGQYFDFAREVTFARVLRKAGYATAVAGKWQVNDLRVHPDALDRHGFDEHCLWTGFETGNPPSAKRYWDGYLQQNGRRRTHEGRYGPDLCSEFVRDFITRHKDRPFLVYYPLILCHAPYDPTPDNRENPPADRKAQYKAMARYMDKLIGKVVNTLDELAIRDRTIVFFCGDNGSSQGALAWGRQMPGGKGKVSELGVHTPFIANCPGLVPAGRTCDDLIDLSDVLPTLAELAGVRVPDAVTLDGRSFAGSLLGRPTGPRREWIFTQTDSRRVLRDKRFARYSDGRLYDVLADPFEERDLSDSTDQGIVASRSRLKRIMDTLPGDAPMTGFPPTYAQTKMVPDLPAGSGKYKPMEPSSSQESKAKRPKTARKKNRVPAGTGGKTRR